METTAIVIKTKWNIDPAHSQVGFRVKHLMFSNVRGTFRDFEASALTTGEDFTDAVINCTIQPGSIDTGNLKRDEHLRSADFFDVEKFPSIIFQSNKISRTGVQNSYELHGDLSMKGIKKPVKLDLEFGGLIKDPFGVQKAVFRIEGRINRRDWGLSWNAALETGGVLVSEEVHISCEVQLSRQ